MTRHLAYLDRVILCPTAVYRRLVKKQPIKSGQDNPRRERQGSVRTFLSSTPTRTYRLRRRRRCEAYLPESPPTGFQAEDATPNPVGWLSELLDLPQHDTPICRLRAPRRRP